MSDRRVLPTSSDGGMIEFVESVSLARVLAEHRTILAFLHQGIPDAAGAEGRGGGHLFRMVYPMQFPSP